MNSYHSFATFTLSSNILMIYRLQMSLFIFSPSPAIALQSLAHLPIIT